jgi:hypothetical protein
VDPAVSPDEQALRAQLERARERLEGFVRELHALDRELEELSPGCRPHRLVGEVCDRLEELRTLGAAGLFWGDEGGDGGGSRVRSARARVDAFEKHYGDVEERRQAALERVLQQQEGTELLEQDLLELARQEEEREHEWIVEREIGPAPARPLRLPWTRGGEDDVRFRKSLATSLLASLAFAITVPQIDLLPLPEPPAAVEQPKRLARLIPDRRPLRREAKPEPAKPTEQRLAKETPKERAPEPTSKPAPGPGIAPGPKGILAFREKISGVAARDPDAPLGLQARISSVGEVASGQPVRSLLTTKAAGSSGGINLASLSRGVGGGAGQQIGGVEVARVTSAIGGGGGGGGVGATGAGAGGERGGPLLGRTDEEIQIVFDRYKSALYRLYNRELRNDPTLKGQIVLRLKIEPNGSVSLCALQASDMDAPQLAQQVVERVRTFDFGAKEGIAAVTILYPIDFLPAT